MDSFRITRDYYNNNIEWGACDFFFKVIKIIKKK